MHDTTTTETPPSLWTRARAMFARAVAVIGLHQGLPTGDTALAWIARVASIAQLSPRRRAEFISWLAPLEHIVRKLLLAEAAALHRAERARPALRIEHVPLRGLAQHRKIETASLPARISAQPPAQGEPENPRSHLDIARPETWRAQFSLAIPRDPRRVADAHAPRIRALWGEEKKREAPPVISSPDARLDTRACHAHSPAFRLARRFEALRRVLEDPRAHAARLARALKRETARRSGIVRDYLFAPCRANGHDPADPRLGIDAIGEAFAAPDAFDSS